MTTLDHTDLLPAERLLLQAAHAGEPCNLIDPVAKPTHDEISAWHDPNREIRADFLAQLLTNRDPRADVERIDLRGAIVIGNLDVSGPVDIVAFRSAFCRYQDVIAEGSTFAGEARFSGATFTGEARFSGATFTGEAWFSEATFTGEAWFSGATFTGEAWFFEARFTGDAWFSEARFTGDARFSETRFTGEAWFPETRFTGEAWFFGVRFTGVAWFFGATFTGEARFSGATFTGVAWFSGVRFTGEARFFGVRFTGEAWFSGATFTGVAWFSGATFTGVAWFSGATFTGVAWFDEASFTRVAWFDEASFTRDLSFAQVVARTLNFRRSSFNGMVDGAWAAQRVVLDEARFHEAVTIQLLCAEVSLNNTDFRSGGALQFRGAVGATATRFGARTSISDPGSTDWEEWLPGPHLRLVDGTETANDDRTKLSEQLRLQLDIRTAVSSIRRATVADLELSTVDLTDCQFDGAHGLDKMRIDSACTLPSTPEGARFRRPVKFTGREVLAEEREWRRFFASWELGDRPARPEPAVNEPDRHDANENLPDTTTIAGIYRALRKGREDSGDAPGAADFYYGEMEMRRLARREWRKRYNDSADRPRKPSLAEHWLLTAYWAVSGYGLRAWRALAAIAVLILVGATVFATVGVDRSPKVTERLSWMNPVSGAVSYDAVSVPQDFTWWNGLELACRSSVALLRSTTGVPGLTGIGTVTDIALRLLVPVLIALAALAIRGRTKR